MAQWEQSVITARWLVAALGESASPPWWRSEATNATSQRMLERVYPRTYLAASLATAGQSAAIEHDAHIGQIGTYHLFRLPTADEAALHAFVQRPEGREWLRSLVALDDDDHRLPALADLAGGAPAPGVQGPIRCGTVDALHTDAVLARICATYAAGFRAGRPVFPYLEHEGRP